MGIPLLPAERRTRDEKSLQADGVALRLFHRRGHVDGLGHGRVQVGVGVAVGFHLLPPHPDYLGRLAHNVRRPAGDDLYLAAGGEFHALRAGADGLEQGRIGLLRRLRQDPQVIDVGELAVIRDALFRPRLNHHVHGFLEPLPAGVDVHAQAVELLLLVAGADAEVDSAPAEHVQHGYFFGHQDGVVERQDDDRRADADVLRAAHHRAQEGPDSRQQPVAREAMFSQPHFVEPELVGKLNLLQGVVERLGFSETFVEWNDVETAELHKVYPLNVLSAEGQRRGEHTTAPPAIQARTVPQRRHVRV